MAIFAISKLFTEDKSLKANPETRIWVQKTMVKLQEALRDGIVHAFAHGKLPSMTESEFRAFAFATHADAYQQGGLTLVVATSPSLLPAIASIPGKEFIPIYSDNFWATITQVFATLVRVGGDVTAAAAGPAHTGMFQKANQESGMNKLLAIQRQNNEYEALFAKLQGALRGGHLDRIVWLDDVTKKLDETEFEDPYWLAMARTTIAEIDARKRSVAASYRLMLQGHPELFIQLQRYDPSWNNY